MLEWYPPSPSSDECRSGEMSSQPGGNTRVNTRSRFEMLKRPAETCWRTSDSSWLAVKRVELWPTSTVEALLLPDPAPYCFQTPVMPLSLTSAESAASLWARSARPAAVSQYAPR